MKLADATVHAPVELAVGQQRKEAFDLVQLYELIFDLTVGRSGVGSVVVVRRQAALSSFSLASGMASMKVCIGVLP